MADEYFVREWWEPDTGKRWTTYRRKVDGSIHRVKSSKLPLREKREDAAHDLAVWLAEKAPVTRQDRARRAARRAKQWQLNDAWHDLQLGLSEPAHPDRPMPEIDIRALAEALGWPDDTAEVLAAYGQEGGDA